MTPPNSPIPPNSPTPLKSPAPLKLHATIEHWPLSSPFRIAGHIWEVLDVLHVTLEHAGHQGHGEAAGVYFRQDTPDKMLQQVEVNRQHIENGPDTASLQAMLPAGGARNAVDCALWDLLAKIYAKPVWQLLNLPAPKPLLTTFGCGADTPERMALLAQQYREARAIKLKLTGQPIDSLRVQAVREARPDVWLAVDANQGLTPESLDALMPTLVNCRVALIEQPYPVGKEAWLDGMRSPIPIAADETVLTVDDLAKCTGRFQTINIKLDKSGGLTEALALARAARQQGFDTMVGNMIGTSLAMAPAFLVGQLCSVVDLDGPLFLRSDRTHPVQYDGGLLQCPPQLWGDRAHDAH